MRRLLCLILCCGLLFSFTTMAQGAGVLGETDLMFIPTTKTLSPNSFGIAVNFSQYDLSYFNFDFGLVKDLEVGLAAFNYPRETRLSVRGKYQILYEQRDSVGLAVGIQDIGRDDISPYVVISKTFSEAGIKGYLGAGGGSFNGIFGGLDKVFYLGNSKSGSQLRQLNLFLEADSHNLNLGTKIGIGSQTKINFGLVDMDRWILGVTFLLK